MASSRQEKNLNMYEIKTSMEITWTISTHSCDGSKKLISSFFLFFVFLF